MFKNILLFAVLIFVGSVCFAQKTDIQLIELHGATVTYYQKGQSKVDSIIGLEPKVDVTISEDKYAYMDLYENNIYTMSTASEYVDGEYYSDLHVKRVNLEGEVLWTYRDTTHITYAHKDIYVSKDGVFILYEGYFGKLQRHCHLDKLNHEGKREWTIDFGNKYGTQIGDMIQQSPDGNLIVCTGTGELIFLENKDMLVMKPVSEQMFIFEPFE